MLHRRFRASEARRVEGEWTAVRARAGHARRGVECGTHDGASDGKNVGGLNGYGESAKTNAKNQKWLLTGESWVYQTLQMLM